MNGAFRLKGHEWIADTWAELGKAIKAVDPKIQLINGVTALSTFGEFSDILRERGGLGPDSFSGGITGNDDDEIAKSTMDYYNEHKLFFCIGILNKLQVEGPMSEIDEAYKRMCEYTKSHPRFSPGVITAAAHWTPFEYVDGAIAAIKKYGKY